mmetsp:Transcript_103943/g.252337  ORF Transcript_103943/g.252337 Transcript_103943/m.252337 type:complete len:290 (+) Transcript_103943:133-1002(+)
MPLPEHVLYQVGRAAGVRGEEDPRPYKRDELQAHGSSPVECVRGQAFPHELPLLPTVVTLLVHDHELSSQLPRVEPAVEEAPRNLPHDRQAVQGQRQDQQRQPRQQEGDGVPEVRAAGCLGELLLPPLLPDLRQHPPLLQRQAEELRLHAPKEDEEHYHVDKGNLAEHEEHSCRPSQPCRPVPSVSEEMRLRLEGEEKEEPQGQQGGDNGHQDGAHHFLPKLRSFQEVEEAAYEEVEAHGTDTAETGGAAPTGFVVLGLICPQWLLQHCLHQVKERGAECPRGLELPWP